MKTKAFKIDETVFMHVGEDALYVATENGIHKYTPATECRAVKYNAAYGGIIWECSDCKELLWEGDYEIEWVHHMPKYCKMCGAKIVWGEPEEIPF